jgi:hypothetical protein
MTLAAGFSCTDGILLCADRKHTSGVSQFPADKIYEVNGNQVQILVALAGHTDYGKMVVDRLRANIDILTDLSCIKTSLEAAVRSVVRDRITSVFQPSDPAMPQIEAIVGVTQCATDPNFRPCAFKVVNTAVNDIAGIDAVGSGQEIARFYLKWLYPMWDIHVPVHVARVLAVHILELAEAYDPDCGDGFTMRAQGGITMLPPASHFGGHVHPEFRDVMYSLRQVMLGCIDLGRLCTSSASTA